MNQPEYSKKENEEEPEVPAEEEMESLPEAPEMPGEPEPELSQAPEPPPGPEATGTGDQGKSVAALEDELARMKDHMLRALAEADNTRKRAQRDREESAKYAISGFARDLLDFADNFSRALEAIPADLKDIDERIGSVISGIEQMAKELQSTFEKHGITKIEPRDEVFNPNYHEVMFEAPGTGKPAGTVIHMVEPGYLIHDRLLRPARVGVAKDDGQGDEPGSRIDTQA